MIEYYGELEVVDTSNTERRLTRAEFLKLVLHAAGKNEKSLREEMMKGGSGENEGIVGIVDSSGSTGSVESDLTAKYQDLDSSSWYIPYFHYAVKYGVMKGQAVRVNENGMNDMNGSSVVLVMRPNDAISRAEAAKILAEAVKGSENALPDKESIGTFADIDRNSSLAPYVQYAYNTCLLHGRKTHDGVPREGEPRVFEPNDGISLAETVKVLYNLVKG